MEVVPGDRAAEVDLLLHRVRAWAGDRADVRAVALVGSWARGAAGTDSDVDLVLLTRSTWEYVERDAWIGALGAASLSRTRSWGAVTERRLVMPTGLEVDVGIAAPSWAATAPVDRGTAQVVLDALRAVYDPVGLLTRLTSAVAAAQPGCRGPGEEHL